MKSKFKLIKNKNSRPTIYSIKYRSTIVMNVQDYIKKSIAVDLIKRLNKNAIGFGHSTHNEKEKATLFHEVTSRDLEEYGLIPEFIGRLPVVSVLDELTEEDLIAVLTQPDDALLKQQRKLVRGRKRNRNKKPLYDIKFTDKAVREIAKQAKAKGMGARALRSVVEDFMLDIMFELGDQKPTTITITDKVVRGEEEVFKEAA